MAINLYGLWFCGLQKDVSTKPYIQQKVCMSHMFHMVVTLSRLSPQDMLFVLNRTFNHNSSLYTLSVCRIQADISIDRIRLYGGRLS
jgi:hypothetical protein